MTVALSLAAAAAYGLSDFLGGVFSRRASLWPVGMLACVGALLGSLVLALTVPGAPAPADFGWAAVAGVGSGVGTGFLYRGLSGGRMGVVAPVSAVGAALIPLVVGLLGGDRPGLWAWLGIIVAFPGIWLVSREDAAVESSAAGFVDGILAGIGFGLLFAALGQVPEGSGYWPLVLCQVCSVVAIVGVALGFGADPLPRDRADLLGLVPGLLATLAVVMFMLATTHGSLSIAAILTSLYPAFTVLLAVLVLREHVHLAQAVGLALCGATIVLVGMG